MKNIALIIILKEIDQNQYIEALDKSELMTYLLTNNVENIKSDLIPLASIYKSHAESIKRYRISCIDKLKFKMLVQCTDNLSDKLSYDKISRLIYELFEYLEYGKKHIKTKYNSCYYSIYTSQIIKYDKDKSNLSDIQAKRRQARAKETNRPGAYTLLAQDKRIQQFHKGKQSQKYLYDSNIRFLKFWACCPLKKVNKSSCRKLFVADGQINWDNNSFQNMLNMFEIDFDKYKSDLTGVSTFDFLLNTKLCHANLQYITTSDSKMRNELAKRWKENKDNNNLNY